MKRRNFLGLLSLLGCKEDMIIAQHGYLGNLSRSQKVILIIGDSIARGNSTAFGSTPVPNTVRQWDDVNGTIINVGSTDLIEANPAGGSQWPDFGIGYYNLTKNVPVFINTGIGGSLFNAAGSPSLSWYTDGTCWSDSVAKARRCLTYMGRVDPDIVYIHLGISDANAVYTLDPIYVTSLIDRINTEYHSPRILISMIGGPFLTTYSQLLRQTTVRKYIKALMFTYANVEVAGHLGNFILWGSAFNADNIHLNALGNELLGNRLAKQLAVAIPNCHKYTRSIIGMLYHNITATRQTWINDFVLAMESAGLLSELDSLHIFGGIGGDSANRFKNATIDWALLSPAGFTNAGVITDTCAVLDGSTLRIAIGQYSIFMDKSNALTDFIAGVYILDNRSSAATLAYLFCTRESAAGGLIGVRQTGSSSLSIFGGAGTTSTDATEAALADNAMYSVARSGGNQILIKNSTTVQSFAQAATALSPGSNVRAGAVGAINNDGTISGWINADLRMEYCAKFSTWNAAAFKTALDTLLTNWLTSAP